MPKLPCMRLATGCAQCGARDDEDCPYESLTEGLKQTPRAEVRGGDCSGEDGVCETCQ
jgi:hypothetical protein